MSGNLNVTTTVLDNEVQARLDGVTSSTSSTDLVKIYRASELYDAADYTIFAAEVQTRVDSVTGTTTDTDLLKLAASIGKVDNSNSDKLDQAITLLEGGISLTVFQDELAPLATSTELSDTESTILASIEESGGGGTPVNSVVPFYTNDIRLEKDGQVWLQTGYVDDDVASYPDATITYEFNDFSFSVASQDTIPYGISVDDTHVWMVGYDSDYVYQYDKSTGTYTGFNFSVASQEVQPQGISVDDTHVWIVGYTSKRVYQYNKTTGTYTGFSFSVASQDTIPYGISVDDTHVWIVGSGNDSVYQYDKTTGTYTGFSFSVATQEAAPYGISVDDTHVWIVGTGSDSGNQYNKSTGAYTGFNFSVATQDANPYGISVDDTHVWMVGTLSDSVYQYAPTVGIGNVKTDSDTGLPYYVRIK